MKHYVKLTLIISILLIIFGFSMACSNYSTADITSSPGASSSSPSVNAFKVNNLSINPPEINAGIEALITANVINTGDTSKSYVGKIRIDSTSKSGLPTFLASDEVKIPAGATQLLSITTTIRYPGTYKVTWGEVSEELVVNPEEPGNSQSASSSPLIVPAPNFTAVDVVTGKTISLKEFAGSAILLNFVNYGCNPSLNNTVSAQLLAIKQLKEQRNDFVPVSVFCGCCPPEVLRQFAKDNNFDWPWILDTNNSIIPKYINYLKKFGYPTLVFIDKEQLIREATGYSSLPELTETINKLLSVAPVN